MLGFAAFRISVPPWVKNPLWTAARAVPSLDLRFAENKSLADAVTGQSLVTFTRASSGTYVDSQGVIRTATTNEPRFDHNPTTGESLGLLVEEQRTNSILNNTMVGAVAGTPGTLPTNWSTFTALTGLTREVVGVGTENGISYIDVRLSGTPSGSGVYLLNVESISQIAASNGQSWTGSAYCKLQSGSLTGVTSLAVRTAALDVSFVELSVTSQTFVPTNAALSLQRIVASHTNTSASTAYETVYFRLSLSGATIDITLRIGLPQLEQGAFATSVIPTTGTATVTRAADVASITGTNFSSWYRQDEGTVFVDHVYAGTGNSVWVIDDTTTSNFWQVFNASTTGARASTNTFVAGANSGRLDSGGAFSAGTKTRAAVALQAGSRAFSANGVTSSISTSPASVPTMNRLVLAGITSLAASSGQTIARLTYWPQRLSNSTLQQITQ